MSVLCRMGAHRAAGQRVWNNGFYFGSCRRCGCDLVRGAHDRWRAVPKGFRVVWRQRPPGYPDWSNAEPEASPLRMLPRATAIGADKIGLSGMLGRTQPQ